MMRVDIVFITLEVQFLKLLQPNIELNSSDSIQRSTATFIVKGNQLKLCSMSNRKRS